MLIISPSFEDGGFIPKKFSGDGGDLNPELQIQNIPSGTKSLALILHDPDAPMPGGFYHWIVWNIDPRTMLIKEESVPPRRGRGSEQRRDSRLRWSQTAARRDASLPLQTLRAGR